jgi:hypothetical protein
MSSRHDEIDLKRPRDCECDQAETPHIHVRRAQLTSAQFMREHQDHVGKYAKAQRLVVDDA